MVRTKKAKLQIQLVALFLFLVASLATLSISTYAWFATNQRVTASGLRIIADSYDAISGAKYYSSEKPDLTVTPAAYYFDKTPIAANEDKALPTYDRLFSESQHQLLVAIEVNERVLSCQLVAKANSMVITNNSWDDVAWHDNASNDTPNPLSAVVTFVPYQNSQVSEEYRYSKDCYKVSGNNANSSFVSLDNANNPIYDSDAEIVIGQYDTSIDHVVWFTIDYDKELVESIYSYYLVDPLFNTGSDILFACDFTVSVEVLEASK